MRGAGGAGTAASGRELLSADSGAAAVGAPGTEAGRVKAGVRAAKLALGLWRAGAGRGVRGLAERWGGARTQVGRSMRGPRSQGWGSGSP